MHSVKTRGYAGHSGNFWRSRPIELSDPIKKGLLQSKEGPPLAEEPLSDGWATRANPNGEIKMSVPQIDLCDLGRTGGATSNFYFVGFRPMKLALPLLIIMGTRHRRALHMRPLSLEVFFRRGHRMRKNTSRACVHVCARALALHPRHSKRVFAFCAVRRSCPSAT